MAISAGTRPLGQILLEAGLTTPETLERALTRIAGTGERLGEALVAMGVLAGDDVLRALALQHDLAYLARDELPTTLPIVKNLSAPYLRQYRVCPVTIEGNVLTVATSDPTNPLLFDDLRQSLSMQIKAVVSPEDAILEAIERTYAGAVTPLQRLVEGIDEGGAALPPGVTLDPSSGVLSGLPMRTGTFTFTARVTDSASPAQSLTRRLILTIR